MQFSTIWFLFDNQLIKEKKKKRKNFIIVEKINKQKFAEINVSMTETTKSNCIGGRKLFSLYYL